MKFIREFCAICKSEQAMPVVQEDDSHPGIIWVQCPCCREIKPIETGPILPAGEEESPATAAPKERSRSISLEPGSRKVIRHYRSGEKFFTGEWIFHPEWNDTGQVVEKHRSKGGHEIIVVSFQKMGTKRLVSNFAS